MKYTLLALACFVNTSLPRSDSKYIEPFRYLSLFPNYTSSTTEINNTFNNHSAYLPFPNDAFNITEMKFTNFTFAKYNVTRIKFNNPPTLAPVNPLPISCGLTTVIVTTDDFPAETFWTVKDQNGKQVMAGNSYTG